MKLLRQCEEIADEEGFKTVPYQIWSPLSKPHHSVNRSAGSQEVRHVPNKWWRHSGLWPQWRKLGGNKPQGPPAAPIFPPELPLWQWIPGGAGICYLPKAPTQRMVGLGHGNGRFQSRAQLRRIAALPSINILPWINICTIPLCVVSPW